MKLNPGETVLHSEPLSEECFAEIQKCHSDIDDAKKESENLQARIEMLMAKASYLNKNKWVVIDKHHPETVLNKFEGHVCRRLNMEEKTISMVKGCCDHGATLREIRIEGLDGLEGLGGLGDIIASVIRDRKPNKPKEPAPEPAPAG